MTAGERAAAVRALVAAVEPRPSDALERAVADGIELGAGHGIAALEDLAAEPGAGPAIHAALGHFLAVVGRSREAIAAYRSALALQPPAAGRAELERRLAALG